ncbi:SRPBCC family protein [Pacificoceanicola onchidii]|uniref:SRPBCC family protein n=1 Tax=Pacificoceanicola onchidii TaxID=2562685 RepID=UPI0010A67A5E|nr:SRPBCC domain-containing protein [Pacificoceanicola onchidii]
MTHTIRKSVYLPADKPTVWAHLTRAELLGKWFHPAKADLAEGEDFLLVSQKDGDRMCWGRVERATPMDHMRWSFTVGPLNGVMTVVDWTLSDSSGGTLLDLVHSGLPDGAEDYGLTLALDKGWHGFLGNLHGIE